VILNLSVCIMLPPTIFLPILSVSVSAPFPAVDLIKHLRAFALIVIGLQVCAEESGARLVC